LLVNLPTLKVTSTGYTENYAEVAALYRFAESGTGTWSFLIGLRYTDIEWDGRLRVGQLTTLSASFDIEDSWTDVMLGVVYAKNITSDIIWETRIDVASGGTEISWHLNSGVSWRFSELWSSRVSLDYLEYDYDSVGLCTTASTTPCLAAWDLDRNSQLGLSVSVYRHF